MNDVKGFNGENRFYSNFYPSIITYNGITYPSVEHAYQAQKTDNEDLRLEISKLHKASDAKNAGSIIKVPLDWHDKSLQIMTDLVKLKFEHISLKEKLLASGDAYIEETNTWNDTFWGVCNGIGKNCLGRIIMNVREYIKTNDEKYLIAIKLENEVNTTMEKFI